MSLRIFINDRECKSPVVKFGLAAAVLVGTMAMSSLIIFVLLPIIGVSIAAIMGLIIVVLVGIFAAAVALSLGSAILSSLILLVDYLADKLKKPSE